MSLPIVDYYNVTDFLDASTDSIFMHMTVIEEDGFSRPPKTGKVKPVKGYNHVFYVTLTSPVNLDGIPMIGSWQYRVIMGFMPQKGMHSPAVANAFTFQRITFNKIAELLRNGEFGEWGPRKIFIGSLVRNPTIPLHGMMNVALDAVVLSVQQDLLNIEAKEKEARENAETVEGSEDTSSEDPSN